MSELASESMNTAANAPTRRQRSGHVSELASESMNTAANTPTRRQRSAHVSELASADEVVA